jgi:multidrug efflux pump subunit AcrA (membrane-fusion protein)
MQITNEDRERAAEIVDDVLNHYDRAPINFVRRAELETRIAGALAEQRTPPSVLTSPDDIPAAVEQLLKQIDALRAQYGYMEVMRALDQTVVHGRSWYPRFAQSTPMANLYHIWRALAADDAVKAAPQHELMTVDEALSDPQSFVDGMTEIVAPMSAAEQRLREQLARAAEKMRRRTGST